MDSKSLGVVLDAGQPGAVLHAHPMDELASGAHRDVDVLLSMASDDMGWWVANDLDRFDPHTVDRIVDEVAGWRIPRSRAKKIVDAYDQGGRTPAEVRAALLSDYIFGLPADRGGRQRPSPADRARRGRARRARHRDVRAGRPGAAGPQRGTGRA
jgi:para-nitrobenzyl esterase